MYERTNLLKRITARPEVFGGKPIIRGRMRRSRASPCVRSSQCPRFFTG